MDKLMLCLANSYKHGGRCIAGIELAKDSSGCLYIVKGADGTPKWLRPISHSFAGEISNDEARNIRILSVIRIVNFKEAGLYSHAEDLYYDRLEITSEKFIDSNEKLNQCVDNYHRNLFGNKGKAVTPDSFQNGNYSVMLIKVNDAEIYMDTRFEKPKQRMKFRFYNYEYDLPLTDPLFLDRLRQNPELNKIYTSLYIVLSLGVEHEGWHSKLVASIIEPFVEPVVNAYATFSIPNKQSKLKDDETVTLIQNLLDYNKLDYPQKNNIQTVTPFNLDSIKIKPRIEPKTNIDELLSNTKQKTKKEGCYIATMVYGDYSHPKVLILRKFRDQYLYSSILGTLFVNCYYCVSPKIVKILKGHNIINKFIKKILDLFVKYLTEHVF